MPIKKALPKPTPAATTPPQKKKSVKAAYKAPPKATPIPVPKPADKEPEPVAPPSGALAAVPKIQKRGYDEKLLKVASNQANMGPMLDLDSLPGADESCPSVVGQTWECVSLANDKKTSYIHFFEDGTATNDTSPGRWRQKGAALVFDLNGRYAEYVGVISNGTIAEGDANNTKKLRWKWAARRVAP